MLIQQLQPGTGRRIQQKSAKAFCDNQLANGIYNKKHCIFYYHL